MSTELAADKELLIAEYTLGLLDRQEAAQAQALLGAEKEAAAAALQWEDRFLRLVDQLPPLEPSAQMLPHIQARLGLQAARPERQRRRGTGPRAQGSGAAGPAGIWNSLRLWRAVSLCLAIAVLGLALARKAPHQAAGLQAAASAASTRAAGPVSQAPQAPPALPPQLAILQAPGQSSTPAWTVMFDARRDLVFKPLVHSDIPATSSAQLWTHSTESATPRSLGVIDPNQATTVAAANVGEIVPGQIFEITLEPQGGSATGPTGPVLFIGRMIALAP
jgi:anti-sigma-K factor RskA